MAKKLSIAVWLLVSGKGFSPAQDLQNGTSAEQSEWCEG